MYEPRRIPPLTIRKFILRMVLHVGIALIAIGASLLIGMLGYRHFEHMSWLDAFLNAAMLLGGMGPVKVDLSDPGKLFAGFYALYSGLVVIAVMSIILGPVVHRLLHKFHWEKQNASK